MLKSSNLYHVILLLSISISLILFSQVLYTDKYTDNHFAIGLQKTILDDFSFGAAGDWGCSSDAQNTVDNIIDKAPELFLGLGDYAYTNSICWLKLIDPIHEKTNIVIGNHDHLFYIDKSHTRPAPERLRLYTDDFNLTKQYYAFNFKNVHFVAMSTEIPYDKGSAQYNFVKKDLQKASSNSSIDWIVVFYHRLAYTSPALVHSIAAIRDTYHPLFEKYGVDLIIQGHAHNYQRSYPIEYNPDASSRPFIVDRNTTNYYDPEGQIFTIVGTGGAPDEHNFTGPAAPYTAVQFNAYGFLNIDVRRNGTMLEGKFYENNGTVMDHFTITKPKKWNIASASSSSSGQSVPISPKLENGYDNKFRIQTVANGLHSSTDMAFLDNQDILVLNKHDGTVHRIVKGQVQEHPLLDVNVANKVERGLLGIAVSKNNDSSTYVYLYYTESKSDGSDICPSSDRCTRGTEPVGNRLYRYNLVKNHSKLINPHLLLDITPTQSPAHNGGKIALDTENNVFIIVGDMMADGVMTQNYQGGKNPTGSGGILKIDKDGHAPDGGVLGNQYPLNLYYAYGIRNGFGLDFDPVTGNLWDTENGPDFGDEINLVKPGFNSGWKDVQGIWNQESGRIRKGPLNLDKLEDFNGKGNYSEPEFTWNDTVGPTAIKFFNSDKMGTQFKNSIFVGDFHNGNIYHFDLSNDRTSLLLNGPLTDKVANSQDEVQENIFARGFEGITDLEVGPDGYLYILSIRGTIYKIVPN